MSKSFLLWNADELNGEFNGEWLADMANSRAAFFCRFSHNIAVEYGISSPFEGPIGDDYHVDSGKLNALVEAVFSKPIDLIYSWARSIAGMFELAHNQSVNWTWAGEESPIGPFSPYFSVESRPERKAKDELKVVNSLDAHLFASPNVEFIVRDTNQLVGIMEHFRAHLFVAMGNFMDSPEQPYSAYGMSRIVDNVCYIEPVLFCSSVEDIYESSHDLYYVWARYASGIYENVKGNRFIWKWDLNYLPFLTSYPFYVGVEPPPVYESRVIGSG